MSFAITVTGHTGPKQVNTLKVAAACTTQSVVQSHWHMFVQGQIYISVQYKSVRQDPLWDSGVLGSSKGKEDNVPDGAVEGYENVIWGI